MSRYSIIVKYTLGIWKIAYNRYLNLLCVYMYKIKTNCQVVSEVFGGDNDTMMVEFYKLDRTKSNY